MKTILLNPVFSGCLILLGLHQLGQKFLGYSLPVLDNYLDPLLCMPVFLGFILMERRWFFNPDFVFQAWETVFIVVVLALIFELVFPRLSSGFTADWRDVLLYFAGGAVFYFLINK